MLQDLSEFCMLERQKQGLSQKEVSKRSGVSASTIGGFERGQFVPNIYTVECIIEALGYELQVMKKEGRK